MKVAISYDRDHRAEAEQAHKGALEAPGVHTAFIDVGIPPGSAWSEHIESEFGSSDLIIILAGSPRLGPHQMAEVGIAVERWRDPRQAQVLPVLLYDGPPPFLLRAVQAIRRPPDIASAVRAWIQEQQSGSSTPSEQSLSVPHFPILGSHPEMTPWLRHVPRRQHGLAIEILAKIVEILHKNNHFNGVGRLLDHSHFILRSFRALCLEEEAEVGPQNARIVDSNDTVAILIAVIVHNFYILPTLPNVDPDTRKVSGYLNDSDKVTILKKRQDSWKRLQRVKAFLSGGGGQQVVDMIDRAFSFVRVLFSGFQSWTDDSTESTIPEKLDADLLTDPVHRALLLCDSVDVCGTVVPEIVRAIFQRGSGYKAGYVCFFEHTYLAGVDIGFHSRIKPGGRVSLDSPSVREPWINDAIRAFRDIVVRHLEATIARLSRAADERTIHNLDLSVHLKESFTLPQGVTGADPIPHLCWALFPLAIALPASDSDGADVAMNLLPRLAVYVQDVDRREAIRGAVAPGEHVQKQLPRVLKTVASLRAHSQTLGAVVEAAENAIAGGGTDTTNGVRLAMAERAKITNRQHYVDFREVEGAFETPATAFFAFGASRPACDWLSQLASHKRQRVRVYPLYCVRNLLMDRIGDEQEDLIATTPEHEILRKMLVEAAVAAGSSAFIEIAHPTDFALIPRILMPGGDCARRDPGGFEVLLGARALLSDRNQYGAEVVCTYGAHLLAAMASEFGVPVRVVTWQERVDSPFERYEPIRTGHGFNISYSLVQDPSAEDERVPMGDVRYLTTERQSWIDPGSRLPFSGWGPPTRTRSRPQEDP